MTISVPVILLLPYEPSVILSAIYYIIRIHNIIHDLGNYHIAFLRIYSPVNHAHLCGIVYSEAAVSLIALRIMATTSPNRISLTAMHFVFLNCKEVDIFSNFLSVNSFYFFVYITVNAFLLESKISFALPECAESVC